MEAKNREILLNTRKSQWHLTQAQKGLQLAQDAALDNDHAIQDAFVELGEKSSGERLAEMKTMAASRPSLIADIRVLLAQHNLDEHAIHTTGTTRALVDIKNALDRGDLAFVTDMAKLETFVAEADAEEIKVKEEIKEQLVQELRSSSSGNKRKKPDSSAPAAPEVSVERQDEMRQHDGKVDIL